MSDLRQKILDFLRDESRTCGAVSVEIDLNPFSTRAWLETLREDGDIVRELDGTYGLPSRGYSPGGGKAA